MGIALLRQSARVKQKNPTDIELEPSWTALVSIMLDDIEGQLWCYDTSVSETSKIHSLILQFRVFIIEREDSSEILCLSRIVTHCLSNSERKSCACWSLNVQDVRDFIPVIRVKPKGVFIACKDELSSRVEPVVEGRTSRKRRYNNYQWIF